MGPMLIHHMRRDKVLVFKNYSRRVSTQNAVIVVLCDSEICESLEMPILERVLLPQAS